MKRIGTNGMNSQVIIMCMTFIAMILSVWIKVNIVIATEEYKEDVADIQVHQNIDKYFHVTDKQVLLQQRILIDSNEKDAKIESEKLQINVPIIQDRKPKTVNVLANGKKVENQYCYYDTQKNQLNIKIEQDVKIYKIIYEYEDINAKKQEVQLYTKVHTKFENAREVEVQDEKVVEIEPIGENISIQGEITKGVYKGYLYEAKENETNYEENYIIEISNTQNVEAMNISKEKEVFTYEVEMEEGKDKVEMSTNDSLYYTQTIINKEQMLDILGEEGQILIQNGQGETIAVFTKDLQVDENGNMVVSYKEKEMKDLKIITTKPIQLGEIKISNKKAIDAKVGYRKQEIEKFQNIENTIKVNESTNTLQMNLLNTKSEVTMEVNQTDLSALQKNENVQMMLTLQSNENQYDLYKNPIIDILVPEELDIAIKKITQLNFEDIMQVKSAEKIEDEEGKKVVRIVLEGEQESYNSQLQKGIQIAMIGDISIANTVPSKEVNIEVSCKNENAKGETITTQCPINVNSKYGVLMINKVENYNAIQERIETLDDKEISIALDASSEKRIAEQTVQVINNYENPIKEVSVIGNIEEGKQTIGVNFQKIILPENKKAKIYYAETMQTDKNSKQWKENREEVKEVKAYQIVFEEEIQPEESLEIMPLLEIPEDLNPGTTSYVKNTLVYENLKNPETMASNVKFATKNQQANMFTTAKEVELKDLKVHISAISGNQCLQDGDIVKEGQGIQYKIRITNISDTNLSNIVLENTNTNAIYYDTISYEEVVNSVKYTKYKIDENEILTEKTIKINSLEVGETKEVNYQISVKEVEDRNQMLTGKIKIKADNYEEKVIEHITNQIEKASIKTTLRYLHSEDVVTDTFSSIPLAINVKNISNEELQDVIVEMPVAEGCNFSEEENLVIPEDATYEFIEYVDGIVKFKISRIRKNEIVLINVSLGIKEMDITKTQERISQYVKVSSDEIDYFSNNIERTILQAKTEISVEQTVDTEEKIIKDGDRIKFSIMIKNEGVIETNISIIDKIPKGLEVNQVLIKTEKGENKLEISNNLLIETQMIQANEVIEIEIDTTVRENLIFTKEIENYVEINGVNLKKESNKIVFVIEMQEEEDDDIYEPSEDDIDYPDKKDDDEIEYDYNNNGNNSNVDNDNNNSNKNDNTNKDNNNDNSNENNKDIYVYKVSGTAWIDENADGRKDYEEAKIANMTVFLINEETGEELSEKTKQNGSYSFENVKQGKYIVAFRYDTNKYTVATYQKQGVAQDSNSDVMYSVINIQHQEVPVAKTKTLELQTQDLENVDAGFMEGKKFDLKIDKSIRQITIKNNAGTKVNSYQNSKLAKVEIDAKQMESSNIVIQYNIAVTNQGEVAGYANEIIDYLPKDLTLNKANNQTWYALKDGSIATKELANQIISPGETKNITLTVSKKMTQENTGTITNKVRIGKYTNDYGSEDVDNQNNESQADVIVSVRTGRIILYISLTIIIIMIIAVGVYLIKKEVL